MILLCELGPPHTAASIRVGPYHQKRYLILTQPHSHWDTLPALYYRIVHSYLTVLGGGKESPICAPDAHPPQYDHESLTPPLLLSSCSTSGLRLHVDLFEGGRAILALSSSLDNDNAVLRESVRGVGGIPTNFVPIFGRHR